MRHIGRCDIRRWECGIRDAAVVTTSITLATSANIRFFPSNVRIYFLRAAEPLRMVRMTGPGKISNSDRPGPKKKGASVAAGVCQDRRTRVLSMPSASLLVPIKHLRRALSSCRLDESGVDVVAPDGARRCRTSDGRRRDRGLLTCQTDTIRRR